MAADLDEAACRAHPRGEPSTLARNTVDTVVNAGQMQARSTESSATRPSHGTVRWPGRSNRRRRRASALLAQPPSLAVGGPRLRSDTPTRHARRDKKCAARCGQPLAAQPTGLLASPVVGRLPHPSRARSAPPLGELCQHLVTGLRAPCVHRLWMTMWTGKGGVGHHGHNERDQGPIRLSPTVMLTRSTERLTRTRGWKP